MKMSSTDKKSSTKCFAPGTVLVSILKAKATPTAEISSIPDSPARPITPNTVECKNNSFQVQETAPNNVNCNYESNLPVVPQKDTPVKSPLINITHNSKIDSAGFYLASTPQNTIIAQNLLWDSEKNVLWMLENDSSVKPLLINQSNNIYSSEGDSSALSLTNTPQITLLQNEVWNAKSNLPVTSEGNLVKSSLFDFNCDNVTHNSKSNSSVSSLTNVLQNTVVKNDVCNSESDFPLTFQRNNAIKLPLIDTAHSSNVDFKFQSDSSKPGAINVPQNITVQNDGWNSENNLLLLSQKENSNKSHSVNVISNSAAYNSSVPILINAPQNTVVKNDVCNSESDVPLTSQKNSAIKSPLIDTAHSNNVDFKFQSDSSKPGVINVPQNIVVQNGGWNSENNSSKPGVINVPQNIVVQNGGWNSENNLLLLSQKEISNKSPSVNIISNSAAYNSSVPILINAPQYTNGTVTYNPVYISENNSPLLNLVGNSSSSNNILNSNIIYNERKSPFLSLNTFQSFSEKPPNIVCNNSAFNSENNPPFISLPGTLQNSFERVSDQIHSFNGNASSFLTGNSQSSLGTFSNAATSNINGNSPLVTNSTQKFGKTNTGDVVLLVPLELFTKSQSTATKPQCTSSNINVQNISDPIGIERKSSESINIKTENILESDIEVKNTLNSISITTSDLNLSNITMKNLPEPANVKTENVPNSFDIKVENISDSMDIKKENVSEFKSELGNISNPVVCAAGSVSISGYQTAIGDVPMYVFQPFADVTSKDIQGKNPIKVFNSEPDTEAKNTLNNISITTSDVNLSNITMKNLPEPVKVKTKNVPSSFDVKVENIQDSEFETHVSNHVPEIKSSTILTDIKMEDVSDCMDIKRENVSDFKTELENISNSFGCTAGSVSISDYQSTIGDTPMYVYLPFDEVTSKDIKGKNPTGVCKLIPETEIKLNEQHIENSNNQQDLSLADVLSPLYKYLDGNKCLLCGFESKASETHKARRHLATHLKEKSFKCEICDKRFATPANLSLHKAVHSDEYLHICETCGEKFKSRAKLYKHRKTHIFPKPYLCTICNNRYNSSGSLRQHQRIHTGEEPYMCSVCSKTFRTRCMLKNHSLTHNEEKLYSCEICHKGYNKKSILTDHMNSHKGTPSHKCKICAKTFNFRSNLVQHMLVHNENRRHICETCGMKFKLPHHLRSHILTHESS